MQSFVLCFLALLAFSKLSPSAAAVTAANSSEKIISEWYQTSGSNYNMISQVMHVYYSNLYVWTTANSMPNYTVGLLKNFFYFIHSRIISKLLQIYN
jgi:hypothetical protein